MDSVVKPDNASGRAIYPASHLRVGLYEVDVFRREVRGIDGACKRLTMKSLHVLIALAQADGEVVSRDDLLATVWPRTQPTDDVLTQAVAQLRRTFNEDPQAPVYIETLARIGYRLVVPSRWHSADEGSGSATPAVAVPAEAATGTAPCNQAAPLPDPGVEPVAKRGKWAKVVIAVALLAAVVAAVGWAMRPAPAHPATATVLAYQAIASSPGVERSPALSPDGSHVVFAYTEPGAAGTVLKLSRTGSRGARQLTRPGPQQSDQFPAWSRDGSRIAFLRQGPDHCQLMVLVVDDGSERVAGDCAAGEHPYIDWLPDGSGIVMGGLSSKGSAAGLSRLDLATHRWQPLDYTVDAGVVDSMPKFSPDGRWLGFRRGLSLADIWMMPVGGGDARRLTRVSGDVRGWDWLPDGTGLVYSLVKDEARLFVLDLASGTTTSLPELSRFNILHPDVAADSWSMVMELDQLRTQMWRVRLDDPAVWQPVFPSSGVDMLPGVSPDGRHVAFASDRALSPAIWLGEVDHPATLKAVNGIVPVPRHPAAWAADSRRFLVVGKTAQGDRLYEVDAASGQAQLIPVPLSTPTFAAYTRHDDELLVGGGGSDGRQKMVLYRRSDWTPLATLDDVTYARYDAHAHRVCFLRTLDRDLWCADPDLGNVVLAGQAPPLPENHRNWVLAESGIHRYGTPAACDALGEMASQSTRTSCMMLDRAVTPGAASVDVLGGWLYLTVPVQTDVDVGWGELQRTGDL